MIATVAFDYPRTGFEEKPFLFRGWADTANKVALAITILLLASWALPNIPGLIASGSAEFYAVYALAGFNVLAFVMSVVHRIRIMQHFSKNNIEFEEFKNCTRNADDENLDCVTRGELSPEGILILSDVYFYHIGLYKGSASTEHKTLAQNFQNGSWKSPYSYQPLTIFDKVKYLQKRAELFGEDHHRFISFCARSLEELVDLANKLCAQEILATKIAACQRFTEAANEEFLSHCMISSYEAGKKPEEEMPVTLTLKALLSSVKTEMDAEVAGVRIWNSLRKEGCVRAVNVPSSIGAMAEALAISLN